MKTKLKYICLSAAAGLTLSLSSCSDFMDLTPEDSMTKQQSGRMQI